MNTLCLPFYKDFEDCELDGDDVDARYLIDSDFSDGTLTLTFSEGGVLDWIGFGEPYIIRWGTPESNPGTTLTDPVFTDVVIPSYYTSADAITAALASASCKTDYVDFIGTYSPLPLYESGDEKHNLYLGAANTLYYPTTPSFHVNAFRGYFHLKNGLTVGEPSSPNAVRAFNLNFADGSEEAQGIRDNKREPITNNHWYTIDGVRLDGKPTKKGLYIHGGRKVVVK